MVPPVTPAIVTTLVVVQSIEIGTPALVAGGDEGEIGEAVAATLAPGGDAPQPTRRSAIAETNTRMHCFRYQVDSKKELKLLIWQDFRDAYRFYFKYANVRVKWPSGIPRSQYV